ncbi:acyl-CoA dehydrogenase [Salipiger sp. 1_MG-2023]|uniref:acyl-CoA dehydrogenase family protein n=1 Tax=Salipiger sp. 1_MG-2023 TaxID=3062665 RepID=UPI0026E29F63|nr:acyl-CoA dehydrogenase family protein [Salipiger sp. 1_MG-2023]MDO6587662.1 acyl-CoA dehydrogenase [Salipiger sp. 1_MG-2023]
MLTFKNIASQPEQAGSGREGRPGERPEDRLTAASVRPAAAGLEDCGPHELARRLRDAAAIDLSLGRLLEGHANALRLVMTYGDDADRAALRSDLKAGNIFGVWGADATPPVGTDGERLSGAKRFASGLGIVDQAIVTTGSGAEQQLYLVDATDPERHDPGCWDMSGMQASRSGRFDCSDLAARPIGPPGCYTTEPHFVGGTWRIAAVAVGGITGLLDRAATQLRARNHLQADAHLLRLSPIALRVTAAWAATLRAGRYAQGASGAAAPEKAAVLSVSTRLLTEELGQDCIAAVERSVGLSMFASDDDTGRHARDLACYLRQAARDAFLMQVGRVMLGRPGGMAEWLDDCD